MSPATRGVALRGDASLWGVVEARMMPLRAIAPGERPNHPKRRLSSEKLALAGAGRALRGIGRAPLATFPPETTPALA